MRETPNLEKSEKLPPEYRYFNISVLWIFYFRHVIRALYRLRIPHEAVTMLSILFGIIAAYYFSAGYFILAAVAIHLKDVFDASDGALARLTGRGHLIGRYLDSLGDFFTLTLIMIAIGWHAIQSGLSGYGFWSLTAVISTFIQCSFFNYYQLGYVAAFGIDSLSSQQDERARDDLRERTSSPLGRVVLTALRFCYLIVYGWQDRLVAISDNTLMGARPLPNDRIRYGNRSLMILQSALCFGTHIFVIVLFSLLRKPHLALVFISTVMNLYLFLLLYLRKRYYQNASPTPAVSSTASAKHTG